MSDQASTSRRDGQMPQDYDALVLELEATRCRLTQALRLHDEYRELTDLQRTRIRFLEQGKSPGGTAPAHQDDAPHARRRRAEIATEREPPDHLAPAPVTAFRRPRLDLVGPGGAVPPDEARWQQRLCQNPLCSVTPSPGRAYCSGGCATKHRWAEAARLRKSEAALPRAHRPEGTVPIDQDRLHRNLCQNPSCEEEPGASRRYCSYSCAAFHRNAVRREQLAAAREGEDPIQPDHGPPEPIGITPVRPTPPSPSANHRLREMERELILRTLAQMHGNRTHAARDLGISIRTMRNKLRTYRELEPQP